MESTKADLFRNVTWAAINEWAGSTIVSRGKSYHRSRSVHDLGLTADGAVVAWVEGTQRYATLVDIQGDKLAAACTCPYDGVCKHAVAVVLEYVERLKQEHAEIPVVTERDKRLTCLRRYAEAGADYIEDYDVADESEGEDDEEDDGADVAQSRSSAMTVSAAVRSYLESQTKAQLITLLEEMAGRHPDVRRSLKDRADLSRGMVARLVKAVREGIDTASDEPGYRRGWGDDGFKPDYSGVRESLETLLNEGHADEVVKLGEYLLEAVPAQLEMTNDDGETGDEISSCMDVVFRALARSSLPPVDRMLWAVRVELEDDYGLCEGSGSFWESEFSVEDWRTLADKLRQLLDEQEPVNEGRGFSKRYHRDQLSNWLIQALEEAGHQEEIIPLCEREARETGSYVRLAERLIGAGRVDEAEQWIREGMGSVGRDWRGTANRLRTILRQIREKDNNWFEVAAFRAEDFFDDSSLAKWAELQKAAEQAGAWPEVRAAAWHYLETGELPRMLSQPSGTMSNLPWPLPATSVAKKADDRCREFPMVNSLIDIAIAEQRPDVVMHWYDIGESLPAGHGQRISSWFPHNKVADAVVGAYPDRALGIWRKLAEEQIERTQPSAYEAAAKPLNKMRTLLTKLGREDEWQGYLAQLRSANSRKRRLLEVLDGLRAQRIIDGK